MPDHHDFGTTQRTELPRPEMNYLPVNSSMLDAVAYDAASSTLRVRFKNGTQYEYSGVPVTIYRRLLTETSNAVYFHAQVGEAGYWCRQLR
jgi:hypothetical protein